MIKRPDELTQKEAILQILRDGAARGRAVSMRVLNRVGYRYGGRLDELRHDGYVIETQRVYDDKTHAFTGEFMYLLVSEPGGKPPAKPAKVKPAPEPGELFTLPEAPGAGYPD